MSRKVLLAAFSSLLAAFSFQSNAKATGDLWVEGSYEFLNLPDVQYTSIMNSEFGGDLEHQETLANDEGDFDGFRFDAGIANIALIDGLIAGVRGFYAEHESSDAPIVCGSGANTPNSGQCFPLPLFDPDPNLRSYPIFALGGIQSFTTERDINHWGLALDLTPQNMMGLRAGPAFRRIDQDIMITGSEVSNPPTGGAPDPYQFSYEEDLETNYWGAFVGANGSIDLGGGWSLQGDAEAGLYWADTDYLGAYSVVNSIVAAGVTNANVTQQLSLDSDELAFIGVLKGTVERDFGLFKLGAFGRVEYISSAPEVAYNDFERSGGTFEVFGGPHDGTTIGDRYAYSVSTGARLTVPMGSGQ